jgi:signal transduction histidine kinase
MRPKEDIKNFILKIKENPGKISKRGVWRHIKKDGTIIHVEIVTHDILLDGKLRRLVLSNDVTDKLKVQEQLMESHEQLRNLSAHLETIREEERAHISREIHDELGQQLTALKIDLARIQKNEKEIELKSSLNDVMNLLDTTVLSVRKITSQLRPGVLDDLGLTSALDWQSHDFEKRTGIKCNFTNTVKNDSFGKHITNTVFRIYQEALTNIARHSKASEVNAVISSIKGTVTLKIHDNGKGFEENIIQSKKTLGIVGMKERAMMIDGELVIQSKKNEGTTIILNAPLDLKQPV